MKQRSHDAVWRRMRWSEWKCFCRSSSPEFKVNTKLNEVGHKPNCKFPEMFSFSACLLNSSSRATRVWRAIDWWAPLVCSSAHRSAIHSTSIILTRSCRPMQSPVQLTPGFQTAERTKPACTSRSLHLYSYCIVGFYNVMSDVKVSDG